MKIGELADKTGTTTKTLRFYEDEGLLPPATRTASGYRDYTQDSITRVDFIHRAQAAGLTLAQIRQILGIRDGGHAPCTHVRDVLDTRMAEVDEQISKLVALRATIAELRDRADVVEPESCSPSEVCRYL